MKDRSLWQQTAGVFGAQQTQEKARPLQNVHACVCAQTQTNKQISKHACMHAVATFVRQVHLRAHMSCGCAFAVTSTGFGNATTKTTKTTRISCKMTFYFSTPFVVCLINNNGKIKHLLYNK